ncbi:hypothetical protein TSUD_391430 [Trifolium subterraneum]|uniref:Uncharacterized protein n=1 Tax=Trifolium subterraneum TaxID=3900 RepID=A0A2Z6P5M5_TRISU|nr:hypothetical protein TSUD_391430 [Trifolium subterraneum]
MVMGSGCRKDDEDRNFEEEAIEEEDGQGLKVEERVVGNYECLENNIIDKTVRLNKITLAQERGKYARLCVEVDLSKTQLALWPLQRRLPRQDQSQYCMRDNYGGMGGSEGGRGNNVFMNF